MSLRRIETSSGMQACEGKTNLETAVEFLLRPRQRGLSLLDHWLRPIPAKMAPFIIGADICTPESDEMGLSATIYY